MVEIVQDADFYCVNSMMGFNYLRESQLDLYAKILENNRVVVNTRRRWGKTTTALVAICDLSMKDKIITRFGGQTQNSAYQLLEYIISQIYKDVDSSLKPKFKWGKWIFPGTGSEIFVFGNADSAESDKARGTAADILYLDEYAFWKFKPQYVLESILLPQLSKSKLKKVIITSTPPVDLLHHYVQIVHEAKSNDTLFEHNINDSLACGDITTEEYNDIVKNCGGIDTEVFKREWLAQLVANSSYLVVPEAQNESLYVGIQDRPPYYQYRMMVDFGLRDNTAAIFGYLDFLKNRVIIEDEIVVNYKTTKELVAMLRDKEKELNVINVSRMGDSADSQQIADLSIDYKYSVSPISKRQDQSGQGFRDSVINGIRVAITSGKLLIHPRCQNTIACLKYAIWNNSRKDFERSSKLGHFDAGMALCYFYDNINFKLNPYPAVPEGIKSSTHFINLDELKEDRNDSYSKFKKLMSK